jgi:hypothetical protein
MSNRMMDMNPNRDEAGPLWLLLENALESSPVRPIWILLAALLAFAIAALVAVVFASSKRRK